jgi:hypothetical protein
MLPHCSIKRAFPGEKFSLEGVWQPSARLFLQVWQLHPWHIALLRLELSTSGIDMGFPVFLIRM